MTGHMARMEQVSAFKVLTGKPTRKRHLRRPRNRWEDHIRMDPKRHRLSIRGTRLIWLRILIMRESL